MASSSQTIWQGKTLEEIRQTLRQKMPELAKRYSVKSLGIFGSYVRGEARSTSDLDILVEFDHAPTLLEFIQLESDLSEQLGIQVDLVMKKALKPNIGRYVLEEVVAV
jgi:predicted nucleotidyltransferase